MFRVYFINFDYFADKTFNSFEEALSYLKSTTFEGTVYKGNERIASYSYFSGTKYWNK